MASRAGFLEGKTLGANQIEFVNPVVHTGRSLTSSNVTSNGISAKVRTPCERVHHFIT